MTVRPAVHARASARAVFRTMGHIAGTLGNGRRGCGTVEWHGVLRRSAGAADALSRNTFGHFRETLATNLIGTMCGTAAVLPTLLAQGHGAIALVGSVAGYGGLPKATVYGPSKAALINFAEVLHLDLAPRGIGVFLINPGFVATPLTAQNQFAMPALLTPDQAAVAILKGWARGAFEIHFPRRFTLWLKLMRHLPDTLYFALVRRATGL